MREIIAMQTRLFENQMKHHHIETIQDFVYILLLHDALWVSDLKGNELAYLAANISIPRNIQATVRVSLTAFSESYNENQEQKGEWEITRKKMQLQENWSLEACKYSAQKEQWFLPCKPVVVSHLIKKSKILCLHTIQRWFKII